MRKWIIEIILYTVYMIFGAVWATTGSIMPDIMEDFHISVSQASLMSNAILWAKIIGTFVTAVLVARIKIPKAYFIGCLMIASSLFLPFINNFYFLLFIRFLNGLGGAICLVALVPTVARFFDNRMSGIINSVNATSNIIGTIIALILTGPLTILLGGWRNLLAAYGIIILILGIIWLFSFRDQDDSEQKKSPSLDEKPDVGELKKVITSRVVWGMIAQYMGPMIMMLFMFTYLPLYYAKYASLAENSIAHFSATVNQVGIIIGAFIGPYFKSRKYHYKSLFAVTSMIMVVTTFVMFFASQDIIILICSFLTGSVFATWFAFIFSIPKEELDNPSSKTLTYAMSTFWFVTFILVTINSQLIAFSIDWSNGFTLCFSYVVALMTLSPILAYIIFPKKEKAIK